MSSLSAPTANALIDKGIFFNGSSYAAYDSGGYVRAYGNASDTNYVTATGSNNIANTAANNVALVGSVTAQASAAINTLNMGANSLTMASGATFSANGILVSGSGSSTISGGGNISSTTASTDLVIRTDLSSDVLTLSMPIINNGTTALTKSGNGTLVLSGTTNTYTGATTVDAGTLIVSGSSLSTTDITVNAGNAEL